MAIPARGFYTGMRRGEILSLTWGKVDLRDRAIRLEASDTRGKEAHTIPIYDELYTVLARLPRSIYENHVFLYRGEPGSDIRTALKILARKQESSMDVS
jgi:integrase